MDIRTKLALALVSVALVSMAILGTFAYKTSAGLLKEISIRQLDALAESKKRDLIKVYEGWQDQIRLIRSRTQLRTSLRKYMESGDPEALGNINRIVEDAATAVKNVEGITVLDLEGKEIASFGDATFVEGYNIPDDIDEVQYQGALLDEQGVEVAFSTLLSLEGSPLGAMSVVIDASDLLSVTGNYTGLGETGEAMVVMRTNDSSVMVLNPLRHQADETYDFDHSAEDVQAVLEGREMVFTRNVEDYRGVNIWSATRFVPGLEWGLIVKIDADEEEKRASELRDALVDISLALSAFAIIGGTLLGLYLARPIHQLAETVERMRKGETHLRANTRGDDEIAYLAESLNELMDNLQSESDDKRPDA
ncbi:MAG: HAMP domain-containing protein [Pseudomonadales bacterium]|nr:HAMP domain-containing protein [Pseudomonadales bacterium]